MCISFFKLQKKSYHQHIITRQKLVKELKEKIIQIGNKPVFVWGGVCTINVCLKCKINIPHHLNIKGTEWTAG